MLVDQTVRFSVKCWLQKQDIRDQSNRSDNQSVAKLRIRYYTIMILTSTPCPALTQVDSFSKGNWVLQDSPPIRRLGAQDSHRWRWIWQRLEGVSMSSYSVKIAQRVAFIIYGTPNRQRELTLQFDRAQLSLGHWRRLVKSFDGF